MKIIRRASGPWRVQILHCLVLVVVSYQVIFDSGAPQGQWLAEERSPTSPRPPVDLPGASGERSKLLFSAPGGNKSDPRGLLDASND